MDRNKREELLKAYDLDTAVEIRQDRRGMINETFFVEDDRVLTVFRHRPEAQVRTIVDLVQRDPTGLFPRVINGRIGPVAAVGGKPAVMWWRIKGKHFVGRDHGDKEPIPEAGHISIAESFWELHAYLNESSGQAARLGRMVYAGRTRTEPADLALSELPACLHKPYIAEYLETVELPLKYPTLLHRDFERQNLLHLNSGMVSGVVDADSLMEGDLLFEYGHVMMNFVFSDPAYTPRDAEHYVDAMLRHGLVDQKDIALLPRLIRSFAAKDLVDYHRYDEIPPKTDLARLSSIYDMALNRMESFFKDLSLPNTYRPHNKRPCGGSKPCF